MPKCIYCKVEKEQADFSFEHIIPQFLGGAQAPDNLKTNCVCQRCNSTLGLFVDASFEKDFLVYNELQGMAYAFFNPNKPTAFPLTNMAHSEFNPPGMQDDEVCERWLGPFGEQVYWVRPKDERMYWYAGGNPITAKKMETRAYYMWAEASQKNPTITWLTFQDSFVGRKIKKIMLTQIDGADPRDIGFSEPDELDVRRTEYFRRMCRNGKTKKGRIPMYLNNHIRFMSKLAVGLSHVLFGEEVSNNSYMQELYKGLWFKEGDNKPQIECSSNFDGKGLVLKEHCGVSNAVTVTILPVSTRIVVNLNLNRKMNWTITCAKVDDISNELMHELGDGICIVLYKTLNKGLKLGLPELLAHNLGNIEHSELASVEKLVDLHSNYFQSPF